MEKHFNCGRPPGKKKTAKIEVSIEPDIKRKFMVLISNEGKTASVQINQWIREYIKKKEKEGN